jgi:hypothetical protein
MQVDKILNSAAPSLFQDIAFTEHSEVHTPLLENFLFLFSRDRIFNDKKDRQMEK